MDSPLVSIVIPFYNEEKYLSRAINSVLNQTYQNIEIILVDDGSIDASNKIALNICQKYSQCKLISSKNIGTGNARNIGLENCSGEFVVFLDADDKLLPEMVDLMYENITKSNSDVAICKFDLINSKGSYISTQGFKNISNNMSITDACLEMYNHNIAVTVWAKMYRIETAKTVKFPKNLWFEDRPYLLQCFLKSNNVSFVEKSLLKVYSRSNSITRRTITARRILNQHEIYKLEMNIAEQENHLKLSKVIVDYHLNVLIDTFFILYIDKKQITDLNDIRRLFLAFLTKFETDYKKRNIRLNIKKKILFRLIALPYFLPWNLSSLIVKIVLFKKFKRVEFLKVS